MHLLATTLLLACLAAPAAADDPPRLVLAVGEEKTPLGILPRCDDLAVVTITADGMGVKGVRAGETICSFDTSRGGGIRQVYRVVVVAKKDAAAGQQSDGTKPVAR